MRADLLRKFKTDPELYRQHVVIDTATGPKLLKPDPWQVEDFVRLDPLWKRAAGLPVESDHAAAFVERGRGHSKSHDLITMALWVLAFGKKNSRGHVYCVDAEQGQLHTDFAARMIGLNSWLDFLQVSRARIENPHNGGVLKIESSDIASSFGPLATYFLADEFCYWPDRAERLWESIFSSAGKNNAPLFVASNAGMVGTWSWDVREKIKSDPGWIFSSQRGCVASWISQAQLERQRRLLPDVAFRRLWLNEPALGGGDLLTPAELQASLVLPGPPIGAESFAFFLAGDLSRSKDSTAIVVIGLDEAGRVYLAATQRWRPAKGRPIDFAEVESCILHLSRQYRCQAVRIESYEAAYLTQRLQRAGLHQADIVAPTLARQQRQSAGLLRRFRDRMILLYDEPDLLADLREARVEESSGQLGGWKIKSPQNERGHGDSLSALLIAVEMADELGGVPWASDAISCGGQALTGGLARSRDGRSMADALEDRDVFGSGGRRRESRTVVQMPKGPPWAPFGPADGGVGFGEW